MGETKTTSLKFKETCLATGVSTEVLLEIVEHGIVVPRGNAPQEWTFTPRATLIVKRAYRLKRDLGIDWEGVALAMQLLAERDRLRVENKRLKQRLQRFMAE